MWEATRNISKKESKKYYRYAINYSRQIGVEDFAVKNSSRQLTGKASGIRSYSHIIEGNKQQSRT